MICGVYAVIVRKKFRRNKRWPSTGFEAWPNHESRCRALGQERTCTWYIHKCCLCENFARNDAAAKGTALVAAMLDTPGKSKFSQGSALAGRIVHLLVEIYGIWAGRRLDNSLVDTKMKAQGFQCEHHENRYAITDPSTSTLAKKDSLGVSVCQRNPSRTLLSTYQAERQWAGGGFGVFVISASVTVAGRLRDRCLARSPVAGCCRADSGSRAIRSS